MPPREKRPSFLAGMQKMLGKKPDAPDAASKMGNVDRLFFGEEDDDDEPIAKREGTGLLDDEPDRAETDFYNGDKYVGDVTNGKRHGHGVYYYDSGDKYTGNWNQGKQEGHGVYVYANGDRYVGEWLQGKHSGAGTYYFKSGKIFQGSYKTGSPSGHGVRAPAACDASFFHMHPFHARSPPHRARRQVFLYTNGEKLDGEWNGSAYPDYGIYTYANGDRYGGSWKQGKKHGIGTYYFVSGAKYQGEYKDGEPHGTATFIEKNGNAYEEVWERGKRVRRTLITQMNYTGSAVYSAPAPSAAPSATEDLVFALNAATLVNGPEVTRGQVPQSVSAPAAVAPAAVAPTVVGGDDLLFLD